MPMHGGIRSFRPLYVGGEEKPEKGSPKEKYRIVCALSLSKWPQAVEKQTFLWRTKRATVLFAIFAIPLREKLQVLEMRLTY